VDGPLRFLVTVFVLQSALLGRLFVRSVWLGEALTCVAPGLGPLAGRDSEDDR
jgi:hypothetical protein